MGVMEALEAVAVRNKRPKRTFYVALGHDEEVGGKRGAARIAKHLKVCVTYTEIGMVRNNSSNKM